MAKLTPFQRHAIRQKAQAEASVSGLDMTGNSQYDLLMAKLIVDRRRVSDINSIMKKIEIKAELLPSYDDWVAGVLSAGTGAQDDILVTMMVWAIDVGDYERALPLIEYNIKHKLTLPDAYARDITTFVVDEVSDAAINRQKTDESFDLEVLKKIKNLTDDEDYNDLAKAKLLRALGTEQYSQGLKEDALTSLKEAFNLNTKVGVKALIDRLEKELSTGA